MKLDLSKAYDHVDWSFLLRVLVAFGFSSKVLNIVLQLISLMTFYVLINGFPSTFFKASRGLRQGDPLSPIIFVIMADSLSRYLNSLIERG